MHDSTHGGAKTSLPLTPVTEHSMRLNTAASAACGLMPCGGLRAAVMMTHGVRMHTIFTGTQAAARELEEGVAQLQQQHVRVIVLEDQHHTVHAPAHTLHPVPVQDNTCTELQTFYTPVHNMDINEKAGKHDSAQDPHLASMRASFSETLVSFSNLGALVPKLYDEAG